MARASAMTRAAIGLLCVFACLRYAAAVGVPAGDDVMVIDVHHEPAAAQGLVLEQKVLAIGALLPRARQ